MLARLRRLATAHSGLALRLRLFGLLLLLIPLFAGLQRLVTDAVPQIEVQFISDDRPTPVPVERTVERIIYVPVPADETPEPSTPAPLSATPGTGLGKP
jgi:hypothetical protein